MSKGESTPAYRGESQGARWCWEKRTPLGEKEKKKKKGGERSAEGGVLDPKSLSAMKSPLLSTKEKGRFIWREEREGSGVSALPRDDTRKTLPVSKKRKKKEPAPQKGKERESQAERAQVFVGGKKPINGYLGKSLIATPTLKRDSTNIGGRGKQKLCKRTGGTISVKRRARSH